MPRTIGDDTQIWKTTAIHHNNPPRVRGDSTTETMYGRNQTSVVAIKNVVTITIIAREVIEISVATAAGAPTTKTIADAAAAAERDTLEETVAARRPATEKITVSGVATTTAHSPTITVVLRPATTGAAAATATSSRVPPPRPSSTPDPCPPALRPSTTSSSANRGRSAWAYRTISIRRRGGTT